MLITNSYVNQKPTIYQSIDGGDHRDALRQSHTFATHFLNVIEKNRRNLIVQILNK